MSREAFYLPDRVSQRNNTRQEPVSRKESPFYETSTTKPSPDVAGNKH